MHSEYTQNTDNKKNTININPIINQPFDHSLLK